MAITSMVTMTLNGMEAAMMTVGRRLLKIPATTRGRTWIRNRNTASTAKPKPCNPCVITLFSSSSRRGAWLSRTSIRDVFGELPRKFREDGVDSFGHFYRVAFRCPYHVEADAGSTVGTGNRGSFGGVDFNHGNVRDADWRTVGMPAAIARCNARVVRKPYGKVPDGVQVGVPVESPQCDRTAVGNYASGGNVHVVPLDCADDVLERQTERVQQARVYRDEDLLVDAALDFDVKHSGDRFQLGQYLGLDNLLQRRDVTLSRYAQLHHGPLIGREREHPGVAGSVREPYAGYPVDDLRFRFCNVGIGAKTRLYRRTAPLEVDVTSSSPSIPMMTSSMGLVTSSATSRGVPC